MTRVRAGLGALLFAGFLVTLFALTLVPTTEVLYARSGGCPDDDALVRTVPRSVSPG